MTVNEYFNKVYYINSFRRSDRKKRITKQLDALGIKAEKFEAVLFPSRHRDQDYENLEINECHDRLYNSGRSGKLGKGEIGCAISHREIWKLALKRNEQRILILEDDAVFCNNFNEYFRLFADKMKKIEYDMWYLGSSCHAGTKHDHTTGLFRKLAQIDGYQLWEAEHRWQTHAYIVDIRVLPYLIRSTKTLTNTIDGMLAKMQEKLKVYAIADDTVNLPTGLITQDNSTSHIMQRNRKI